jgi:hypothetical protein
MMLSKSIVECSVTPSGIAYRAGTWSLAFLNDLQSAYTQQLKLSAKWIASKYALMPPQELASKLKSQFQQWGAEFSPTTLALNESH